MTEPRTGLTPFAEADLALQTFLASYNTQRMVVTRRLLRLASTEVAKHNLRSHDAAIIAILRDTGITDLVAIDKDFRRVDNLELWDGSSFYSGSPNLVEISTEHG